MTPQQAFLLSRIDGSLSEQDLVAMIGMSPEDVASGLNRLRELGAIDLDDEPVVDVTPPPPSEIQVTTAADHGDSSAPLYDPAELDEPVELDRNKRKRILDTFYRLDELSYYDLLGVHALVDKKAIKRAYYALAPEFHPDRFFRKNIGSYKPKIEAIFSQLTLAHDVLTSRAKREQYDEYLAVTQANRALTAIFEAGPSDISAIESEVERSAAQTVSGVSTPAPLRVEAVQSRRETLARKLSGQRSAHPDTSRRGSSAPPEGGLTPTPTPDPSPSDPRSGAEALRVRYEAARAESHRRQVERYVIAAKQALANKDFAAAANAYRIAATLAPDDAAVQKACEETSRVAAAALAEGFLKQAEYEANQNRWAEAALSYAKVCSGRPDDAKAHERAAYATVRSGGNVRRAVEFARRGVELSPKTPEFHVTLARAYASAGLEKSAEAELERAIQLAPNDARIKDLVARAHDSALKDGS